MNDDEFVPVATDEIAYYVDLQLFLGGEAPVIPVHYEGKPILTIVNFHNELILGDDWHRKLGSVPQTVLDEFSDTVNDRTH